MHKRTIIDFKELGERYSFTSPIRELKTKQVTEVKAILQQVLNYQNQGYYVVGYLSYEASEAFEPLFEVKQHQLASEYLAYFTVHDRVETSAFPLEYREVALPDSWEDLSSEEEYASAITRIREEIRQGNTYQVNHTTRLRAKVTSKPLDIYNRLMVEQGAGYNAYIEHDDIAIISASPELFFKVEGNRLVTRPMKGTTSRGLTFKQDQTQKEWLAQDTKNRAENMMIVDLLRNDMGRVCQIGSVKVTKLCDVEQYSTVWQMTSTIEGTLAQADLVDIFDALFPCGSITGAPKISTMSIINQLEPSPRGVYCGTIGLCLPNGNVIFNVPIRTMQLQNQTAYYGVGGGITWDSKWEDEYNETKQKAAVLHRKQAKFEIITTALVENGELTFFEQHLNRLKETCQYFAYPYKEDELKLSINSALKELDQSPYRLRIAISKSGCITIKLTKLTNLSKEFCKAELVERHLDQSPFVYFKTSYRPHIPKSSHEQIFHSPQGILQETSIGNLILEIDGKWYTPHLSDGCLPGLYRQFLLNQGKVTEKSLTLNDLKQSQNVYACNAVRGLYQLYL